jgi:NADH-quinone oxidoreductase subunit L
MVTAGVYMCSRSAAIFTHAPIAMETVAIIGLTTAVFAATIGITQYDIKKVFAYSTVSQLGYMFLGVGVGAFSAGIWHLMTHAFFKALLFLGAGSVIHACHGEQDMRHMGGLRKYAPKTMIVLGCASLAIGGFPFTSGYFSKDAILGAAYVHAPWMYWVGVITAGMTAFYVWRAFWMTFWGDYKGHGHPHESPWSMLGPLVVLAFLSIFGGLLFNVPKILEPLFPLKEEIPGELTLTAISVAFGLAGIAISYYMYVVNTELPGKIVSALGGLYTVVYNKYFVDEIYDAAVVTPLIEGSTTVLWHTVDQGVIDAAVNGVGYQSKGIGGILRLIQSGNIRSYATWVVLGSVVVLVVMGIAGRSL